MTQELAQFDGLKGELTEFVSPTLSLQVTNFNSCQVAIDYLKQVKNFIDRVEAKRTEMVSPLNQRVKAVNEYAREITEPLKEARQYLDRQVLAFREAQEKINQLKLREEEERRRKEALELAAKQEADREALQSELSLEDRAAALFGADSETEVVQESKVNALDELHAEEAAILTSHQRAREWDIRQQTVKNTRKQWKCEALDLSKVPRQYLVITLNTAAVIAAARGGITEIPGVRLWQDLTLAVGANTYVPRAALEGKR